MRASPPNGGGLALNMSDMRLSHLCSGHTNSPKSLHGLCTAARNTLLPCPRYKPQAFTAQITEIPPPMPPT